MAVNLAQKRVPPIGNVRVKNADGSYMVDDNGEPALARMHTPASKIWENANAAMKRKAMKRVRESGGKIEAASESPEDIVDFLCEVTEEFINVETALPEGRYECRYRSREHGLCPYVWFMCWPTSGREFALVRAFVQRLIRSRSA